MIRKIAGRGPDLRDEKGVALPLAVFGLVAVSLLITSALMTSSTEVALSQAHQNGTRALFEADAALEEFVAERAAMTAGTDGRFADGSYTVTPAGGVQHSIVISELYRGGVAESSPGTFRREETYSVLAQPSGGLGRAVGALVEVYRMASSIAFNIDSGLTLGTDATVAGSATISDGSSPGAACDSVAANAAIRHADSTSVNEQGNGHDIYGAIVQDTMGAASLAAHILNGKSIDDLSDLAHIRFGPMFGENLFSGSPSYDNANTDYRWGCPTYLVTGCPSDQAAYYPTVVIDANGSTVDITGAHGQGILVVRNGEVHIRGNFVYSGILIAEGTLRITGTPQIEGAVIAMGDEAVIDPSAETETSGNSLIRYNKCEIVEAQRGLTLQSLESSEQVIDTPTFAWFEVVR